MSHCRSTLERPLGQLSQPVTVQTSFLTPCCLSKDMSSSLLSAYRLKRIWQFPNLNNDTMTTAETVLGSKCSGERMWRGLEMKPQGGGLATPGSAKEHSQSFRCTEMRWEIENVKCALPENYLTPPSSQENLNLSC